MQSTSASDGTYNLTVTFQIGTDLNFAQVLVQNRVASAMAQLPTSVQAQGVTVQQKSTAILQIVALTSPKGSYDSLYLSNYATINLLNELSRIPGVGNVNVFGVGQYAMRIWLDPQKLYSYGLTPGDVINVVKQQSQQVAGGQVGAPPAPANQAFQYTVNVQGRLADPQAIRRHRRQVAERLYHPAARRWAYRARRADLFPGVPPERQAGRRPGDLPEPRCQRAGCGDGGASQDAGTGPARFRRTWSIRSRSTPPAFVTSSIHEVYKTLIEAGILVLIVILVFLQDWRATLVPATTVPVTIIGAFAAMAALHFTVNLSTLFAIILAIGIVVDDAIVVVEGAAHHQERGLSAHDAAIKAMDELFGPIIGITLVLMAVFIPAAFLPGLTGKMYAQFALVIAATALISAINAATLKPTQCAMWLRPPVPPEKRNVFFRGVNLHLQPDRAALCRPDRTHDPPQRADGADRGGIVRWWRSGASGGFQPRSSRPRTRATCWSPRSFPTARRWNARSRPWHRSPRPRLPRPAWTRWSRSTACPCSTTVPPCQAPAWPM